MPNRAVFLYGEHQRMWQEFSNLAVLKQIYEHAKNYALFCPVDGRGKEILPKSATIRAIDEAKDEFVRASGYAKEIKNGCFACSYATASTNRKDIVGHMGYDDCSGCPLRMKKCSESDSLFSKFVSALQRQNFDDAADIAKRIACRRVKKGVVVAEDKEDIPVSMLAPVAC